MNVDGLVCPRCGENDRFHEEVEITATRGMKLVVDDEGKAKFEPDYSSELFYDGHHDVRALSSFVECGCGAQFQDAGELRVTWTNLAPGDVVIAPDGLRGVVERVWERVRRMDVRPDQRFATLVGWHEEFETWQLAPVLANIRSEPLLPA